MGRRKVQVEWNEDGTKKRCETCEHFKKPDEFHYKTKCEACYQDYQKEYRERNREVLAERKRLQRQARKGTREKSKIQQNRERREYLENALIEGSCRYCPESDNACLRYVWHPGIYKLDDAISQFKENVEVEFICLNCAAKEKHLLPAF